LPIEENYLQTGTKHDSSKQIPAFTSLQLMVSAATPGIKLLMIQDTTLHQPVMRMLLYLPGWIM